MIVYFDYPAKESLGQYYENYQNEGYQNDLEQRSDNYRTIIRTLQGIENYLDQTFIKNNKNFIEIPNIAIVEYEMEENGTEIVVRNIYFNSQDSIYSQINLLP